MIQLPPYQMMRVGPAPQALANLIQMEALDTSQVAQCVSELGQLLEAPFPNSIKQKYGASAMCSIHPLMQIEIRYPASSQ